MTNTDNDPAEALPDTPPSDAVQIRCPRLGHQISFSYCRQENQGLPCFKTLDCWYTLFNVHAHLKERLTSEEFKKAFENETKPKVLSLFELIDQARKRQGKTD